MNIKQMTAHIRSRLKSEKIKCRVRMSPVCGADAVQVFTSAPDAFFTSDEIRKIAMIARLNGLTHVRGDAIDENHEAMLAGKQQFDFFMGR